MTINKITVNSFLLYLIFFLTFLGFYAILFLAINAGMSGFTREITIPVRAIIGLSLLALFFVNLNKIKIRKETNVFLLFAFFYFLRITLDYYLHETYYLSTFEVLLYFISFAVIPFLALSTFRLNERYLSHVINAIFLSGFAFSILTVIYYSGFIGQVGRLASSTVGEEVLSPLALSYNAILILGVVIVFLLYNKTSKLRKLISAIIIALAVVPIFLGASRGALIAFFFPFMLMLIAGKSIKFISRTLIVIIFLVVAINYLDQWLESGLLSRFLGISAAIEEGGSSAERLGIWKASFNQFLDFPFFGDKLRVNGYVGYPHNLFFEVLQTMGILGFIPFCILVFSAVKICLTIFENYPTYSWIAVVFIQALVHNMFSGALYNAAWLWTSMAFIFSVKSILKKEL